MGGFFLGFFLKSDFTLKYAFFLVDQDHQGACTLNPTLYAREQECTFLTEQNNLITSYAIIIIANEAYRLLISNYFISLMSSLYYTCTTGKLPWEDTGNIYIGRILRRKQ